jgi:hypothetical protein
VGLERQLQVLEHAELLEHRGLLELAAWVKPFAGIFMDLIPRSPSFVWYQYSTIPPVGQQKGAAAWVRQLQIGSIYSAE